MEALPRIGVLVERGAVEIGEAMRVGREMRGHPVDDDADPGLMQPVDHGGKLLWRAIARGGREEAHGLIAPRSGKGMLGDRHELHMGEVHVLQVIDQQPANDVVIEHFAIGAAPPRAQMHLVDRDRLVMQRTLGTALHPRVVLPVMLVHAMHDRAGGGGLLLTERHRIGLERLQVAMCADDLEFVEIPDGEVRHEQFPQPCAETAAQRVAAAIPCVEMADDADAAGIGGPDREDDALDALMFDRMRAETLPQFLVAAFGDEVFVHLAQHRREPVGVVALPLVAARLHAQPVGRAEFKAIGQLAPEHAFGVHAGQRRDLCALGRDRHHLGGVGGKDGEAHRPGLGPVRPEQFERVAHAAADDRLHARGVGGRCGLGVARVGRHWVSFSSIRASRPLSGMSTHAGRLASS